jgi:hypothetical protein
MTNEIDRIIATLNQQKGELIGVHSMMAALARVLAPTDLSRLLAEFDTEVAHARSTLSYSPVPEEVIEGFEGYVTMWSLIRGKPSQP